MKRINLKKLLEVGVPILIGTSVGFLFGTFCASKKKEGRYKEQIQEPKPIEVRVSIIETPSAHSSEEEEQIHEPEPREVEGTNKSKTSKTPSRIGALPVEVKMQMKEMHDSGVTFKTILEKVGSDYGLIYPNEVSRAIKSLEKRLLTGESL